MKILTIEELNKMSKEELDIEWIEAKQAQNGVESEEESAEYKAYANLIKECYKAK